MTSASQYGAHAGVYEAEKRRTRAMVDGDVAALAVLLDNDCRCVHSSGAVDTKAGYLETLRAGDIGYSWVRSSDQLIIEVGAGAAVSHRMESQLVLSGVPRPYQSRAVALWREAPLRLRLHLATQLGGPASWSCAPTTSSRGVARRFLWPQTPSSIRSQAGLRPHAWALTATPRQR